MENNHFTDGLLVGLGLGVVGGAVAAFWYQDRKKMTPDQVLEKVKGAFVKEGPIEGSWISFEKHPLRKFALRSEGYEGGISRLEDGKIVHYEFLADAYTGTVLDIERISD